MKQFPDILGSNVTSLLVVAPHPDDDVLGCGALVAYAASHMPVHILYATDGSRSHLGSASFPPLRLRRIREREARNAARRLGAKRMTFLRLPDGSVSSLGSAKAARAAEFIGDRIPRLGGAALAYPWRRDPHADHRAVADLVRFALCRRPDVLAIEYAVWLGIIGDAEESAPRPDEGRLIEVDARPWLPVKRRALAAHRSQLGLVVHDAKEAFVLPRKLLDRALGPCERFVLPTSAA